MITAIIYGICFVILATRKESGTKIMAGLCLAYLVLENLILWFFSMQIDFDITLYFNVIWTLDSILLFTMGCTVKGLRQKLIVCLSIPFMLIQVFAIQYPELFPLWVYEFAFRDAHKYFIETFVFVYSWKDNTVPEWIRTAVVIFLVIIAHMV